MPENPTTLITGSAKRIGNEIARSLHLSGHNIMVHYKSSNSSAQQLVDELNHKRANSAACFGADLLDLNDISALIDATVNTFGELNVLINNASTFYPTPIEQANNEDWDDLIGSNLKAPAFLISRASPHLRKSQGCVINIIDIYADRPLSNHPIYCSAKAGLKMLTQSVARDLAPDVRVNGISPGAILWPTDGNTEISKDELLARIPMQRMGTANDIAKAVHFLIHDADYITGQILAVDGGRSVTI